MEDGAGQAKPSEGKQVAPAAPGRPKTEESIRDLIVRIRAETGWGYTKIRQAVNMLGHRVSRQTVKNVLLAAGLGPDPHSDPDTWNKFMARHAETV